MKDTDTRKNIKGFGTIFKKQITRSNGDLYISPVWYIRFYHNSKSHCVSTHETDETKAIKFLKQQIKSLGRGVVQYLEERLKFEDLMEILEGDYARDKKAAAKNLPSYKKHLSEFFSGWRAVSITSDQMDRYIEKRRSEAASNATINRELAALNRGFSLAVEAAKLYHQPHIPKLTENNVRQGFTEPADFDRLLAELPPDINDLVEFLYLCSWRREKAQSLTWDCVFLRENEIRLPDTGTNKGVARLLPLDGRLKGLIQRRHDARIMSCPYVFHRAGKQIKDPRKPWWNACVKAGLGRFVEVINKKGKKVKRYSGLKVHDLRRSGIRNLVRSGVREKVAMDISGHKTRSVFDRYNITSSDDIRQALKAVDSYNEQHRESKVAPIKTK